MNYKEHLIANFMILSLLLVLHQAHPVLTIPQLLLFITGFSLGSFYLTPDTDIRNGILFYPLRKLSKHRGITHKWIFGTLVIVIYLLIIILIAIWIISGMDGENRFISLIIIYHKEILLSILGVVLSNLLHIFLDKIV